uniref:Fe2OG dioxygenase domain-containing protein n=1 Tax=Haptolina brevifila TaxID=156173 RepID=A0A7S2MG55_9EUKA|mmetsp:Transcript_51504/g.102510  ORF Transcript_51504/g.102510 Transcript_51504/m.102510 type:complete len:481 (+) Transcript_51504:269-1711(+)
MLYRTVERARRAVASSFGASLEDLRMSDATFTRLQPVAALSNEDDAYGGGGGDDDELLAASTRSGSLDVGLLRGDQFCYWRPHIDQVSVAEYEYSALLYLAKHGPDEQGGDFEGGRLVFHDPDADRVILPEPGVLVAFDSGAANLHAVQQVTRGSRFALTMWFTRHKDPQAASADPTHMALQRWAAEVEAAAAAHAPIATAAASSFTAPTACYAATAASATMASSATISASFSPFPLAPLSFPAVAPPLPPLPPALQVAGRLPSRDEHLVSSALCSLPANDPLGRALLLAHARGGAQLGETLSKALSIPAALAFASPATAGRVIPGGTTPLAPQFASLLQSRARALDALLTTLRRARAERGAQDSLRHCPPPSTAASVPMAWADQSVKQSACLSETEVASGTLPAGPTALWPGAFSQPAETPDTGDDPFAVFAGDSDGQTPPMPLTPMPPAAMVGVEEMKVTAVEANASSKNDAFSIFDF